MCLERTAILLNGAHRSNGEVRANTQQVIMRGRFRTLSGV